MIAVFVVISVVCSVALLSALTLFAAAVTLIGTDEAGNINECIGCPRDDDAYCEGCKLNPKYWVGGKYVGPERRELKKNRENSDYSIQGGNAE